MEKATLDPALAERLFRRMAAAGNFKYDIARRVETRPGQCGEVCRSYPVVDPRGGRRVIEMFFDGGEFQRAYLCDAEDPDYIFSSWAPCCGVWEPHLQPGELRRRGEDCCPCQTEYELARMAR
jgi:hypothetical protein